MANWQPDVIILRNIQSTDTLFPTIFPLPFFKFFPHLLVHLNINHDLPFHEFNAAFQRIESKVSWKVLFGRKIFYIISFFWNSIVYFLFVSSV